MNLKRESKIFSRQKFALMYGTFVYQENEYCYWTEYCNIPTVTVTETEVAVSFQCTCEGVHGVCQYVCYTSFGIYHAMSAFSL